MPKQMIEIDIPEGYEFLKVDIPKQGDLYLERLGRHGATKAHINFVEEKFIILREAWKPPTFLKPGWIAMDDDGFWVWFDTEPVLGSRSWVAPRPRTLYHIKFDKPTVSSWQESKRRIP